MAAAGFHQLGSDFADQRIALVRDRLQRGKTVYLAGLGAPGMHNSGVALVEVTQAGGPRLIVNNEENASRATNTSPNIRSCRSTRRWPRYAAGGTISARSQRG
jgi:hypothetical protein